MTAALPLPGQLGLPGTGVPDVPMPPPDLYTLNRHAVNTERIGARLREARIAARLTQRKLGDKIGMQRELIVRAESGRHVLALLTIERMATACGVTVASIFAVEDV